MSKLKRWYYPLVTFLIFCYFLFSLSDQVLLKRYYLFNVRTGSMLPTLPLSSLIVVDSGSSINKGDIITYYPDTNKTKKTVTHRLVQVMDYDQGELYQAQGDNNDKPDSWISSEQVLGKVVMTVPFLGGFFNLMEQDLSKLLLIWVPTISIILIETYKIIVQINSTTSQHANT